MVNIKYDYGTKRQEIKKLMRKRLNINNKIRVYSQRLDSYINDVEQVEKEIRTLLKEAKTTI